MISMPEVIGKVVDADTGRGIAFITVALDGKVTATNSQGVFSFIVPPGTYTLRIRSPFHQPITRTITVGNTDVDLGTITIKRVVL